MQEEIAMQQEAAMLYEPEEQTPAAVFLEQVLKQLATKGEAFDPQFLESFLANFKQAQELTVSQLGEILKELHLDSAQMEQLKTFFEAIVRITAKAST